MLRDGRFIETLQKTIDLLVVGGEAVMVLKTPDIYAPEDRAQYALFALFERLSSIERVMQHGLLVRCFAGMNGQKLYLRRCMPGRIDLAQLIAHAKKAGRHRYYLPFTAEEAQRVQMYDYAIDALVEASARQGGMTRDSSVFRVFEEKQALEAAAEKRDIAAIQRELEHANPSCTHIPRIAQSISRLRSSWVRMHAVQLVHELKCRYPEWESIVQSAESFLNAILAIRRDWLYPI